MLNYQSTSYHDVLSVARMLSLAPAPEFDQWLAKMGAMDEGGSPSPQALLAAAMPFSQRRRNDQEPVNPKKACRAARRDAGSHFSCRAGLALTTQANLQFQLDHAEARDAVRALDVASLIEVLRSRNLESFA